MQQLNYIFLKFPMNVAKNHFLDDSHILLNKRTFLTVQTIKQSSVHGFVTLYLTVTLCSSLLL